MVFIVSVLMLDSVSIHEMLMECIILNHALTKCTILQTYKRGTFVRRLYLYCKFHNNDQRTEVFKVIFTTFDQKLAKNRHVFFGKFFFSLE